MKTADLDQRVLIEVPAATVDALGQDQVSWTTLAERFAKVNEEKGREFLKGGSVSEEKIAVCIRYLAVDSTARLTWQGRVYRVVSVTGTFRQGWTWLHCVSTEGPN